MNITATYSVKFNGYAPTLEFPNGGRQVSRSRYNTAEEAQEQAELCKKARINTPDYCIPDPAPNSYMEM